MTVTVISSASPGTMPDAAGFLLEVGFNDLDPARVQIRIHEPRDVRGTVILVPDGNAERYFEDQPGGDDLIFCLQARGWRVVDMAWQHGWFRMPYVSPMGPQAARLSQLAMWVKAEAHKSGEQVRAYGNGLGATGLAMAMIRHRLQLDHVVFGAGPMLADADVECRQPEWPTWAAACRTRFAAYRHLFGERVPPSTSPLQSEVARALPVTAPPGALATAGCLHGAGRHLGTPHTILLGLDDLDTAATHHGILFHSQLGGDIHFADAGHWLAASPDGREAILYAIAGSGGAVADEVVGIKERVSAKVTPAEGEE